MSRYLCLIGVLAVALFAQSGFSAVYTDCSTNYTLNTEYNGLNGGDGFGPWTVTASGAGGWAGTGIWSTTNALITGWTQAFGMIAKGNGSYVYSDRNLRAPLQTNDSLAFDMAVNWDPDKAEGNEKKGFVIYAGTNEIVTVAHLAYPGRIAINGFTNSTALLDYGTIPMHWIFTSVNATTLQVSASSRASTNDVFTTNLTVVSSAVSSFRLQSANNVNDTYDQRQTYFDNFAFTYDGELPELKNLTLNEAAGIWAVTNASAKTLNFVVTRDTTNGAVDVSITSTDTNFVLPSAAAVSMAAGVTSVTFTATAQINGNGNAAKLNIGAVGYNAPAAWDVKGPAYTYSIESNLYEISVGDVINFWINSPAYEHPFVNSLITATVSDGAVLSVSALNPWSSTGEGGQYTSGLLTGLGDGQSTLQIRYDGVLLHSYAFTVVAPYFTISGADAMRIGDSAAYTIRAFDMGESASVFMSDSSVATVSPSTITLGAGITTNLVTVSGVSTGSVSLIVSNAGGWVAYPVMIKTYATNSIAYDDAANSSYDAGFVTAPSPIGTSGFGAWQVLAQTGTSVGVNILTNVPHANYAGILEAGKTFGAYAYGGENAELKLYRPFPADLSAGQEFSMDLGSYYRDGAKYFRVVRMYEGVPYNRFEFFAAGDNYGINIDGIEGTINPGWGWDEARLITFTVRRSDNGNSYTLSLRCSNGDSWSTNIAASVGSWSDGLQGVLIGVYNGGDVATTPQNYSLFNRMAIDLVGTPVVINPPVIETSGIIVLPNGAGLSIPIENAVIGATYSVEQTTNLLASPIVWTVVPGASAVASATNISLSVTNTPSRAYYRVGGAR